MQIITLIVEGDFTSRQFIQHSQGEFGQSHVAVNGKEAVMAVRTALDSDQPYDLICLDTMMPEMDGQEALRLIRAEEQQRGILSTDGAKIIMTTALGDMTNVMSAFQGLCDGYLTKPIRKETLLGELHKFGLIS